MSEILQRLQAAIQKEQIQVRINETPPYSGETAVIDIEHDEQGTFVGLGCLIPPYNTVWYFTELSKLLFKLNKLIGHNLISDIEMLRFWGIAVEDSQIHWDTMLIGHILDSSKKDYSLKGMAERELGIIYPTYDEIVGKKTAKQKNERITLDRQPLDIVSLYNAMDVFATFKLYERQKKACENL